MQTYKTAISNGCKFIRRLSDKAIIGIVDEEGAESYFIDNSSELAASRSSQSSDNGKDPIKSTSASPVTYTLFGNINTAARIRQDGAGAVTVVPDASVTMVGAGGSTITTLTTTSVGSMILIEPIDLTVTPKKYLVIKGGA